MSFIHCKNYAGRDMFMGERKCRAGISPVDAFCGGQLTGWVNKVPCLRTNETDAVCDSADYPTKEESEEKDREFEAFVDRFVKNLGVVRPLIEQAHKATGDWSGTVECPECGKSLRWSKSSYNGHIHAACETGGCVSWME